tara:strand:- start:202 stop:864 length:663 start_codon:yes stop_codon:yes gene_type:complete
MPLSIAVDPTAEFEPGMFAQLGLIGNDTVASVSDGTAPMGIIDDVRTTAFTKTQIDEVILINVAASVIDENGNRVNVEDVTGVLEFPNVIEDSFTSTVGVVLNSVNGIVTVPAGSELNYDSDGDGINDSFNIVVNYIYRVAGRPGDDTTIGSGRITIHYQRGIYATDQFDTTQVYPLNANLYVGLDGKLTSRQPTESHPGVAICTGPPSASIGTIEFMLL